MAMINDPGLNEIARSIFSEPGFSVSDPVRARRAWQLWTERTTPVQRLAAEQVFFLRWIQDQHAAWVHEGRPGGDVPAGEAGARPAAELRFTSESRDYRPAVIQGSTDSRPAIVPAVPEDEPPAGPNSLGGHTSLGTQVQHAVEGTISPQATVGAAAKAAPPAGSNTGRSQPSRDVQSHPAAADNLPGGHRRADAQTMAAAGEQTLPEVLRVTPSPVQQPSRKIAAYQQMFPELYYPVQTPGGPKPLAEFTVHDIGYRIGELRRERREWGSANLGDKARIEDRDRLNARDRVRIAQRLQNIRDAEAEEKRLALAERELDGYDVAVIGELPVEALDACGFRRRVA